MSGLILDSLCEMYSPDLRAMKAVFLGSAFILLLFLASPEFTNPYYTVGVAATVFTIMSSVAILAVERRN